MSCEGVPNSGEMIGPLPRATVDELVRERMEPASYGRFLGGQTDMSDDDRAKAMENFRRPALALAYQVCAEHNLVLIVPRDLDHRLMPYLHTLVSCVHEFPSDILWKARTPIPISLMRIADAFVDGLADVNDSQRSVRIALTQLIESGNSDSAALNEKRWELFTSGFRPTRFSRRRINGVLVHEITHKLSMQHDRDGALLLPREDWIDVMRANGITQILVRSPESYERILRGERGAFDVTAIPLDALPTDDDEFLSCFRRMFRHPHTYSSDPLELVAYAAQGVDLSKANPARNTYNEAFQLGTTRAILARHLFRAATPVASGSSYYYAYQFDGMKWREDVVDTAVQQPLAVSPLAMPPIVETSRVPRFDIRRHSDSAAFEVGEFDRLFGLVSAQFPQMTATPDATLFRRVFDLCNEYIREHFFDFFEPIPAQYKKNIRTIAEGDNRDILDVTVAWIVQLLVFRLIGEQHGFSPVTSLSRDDDSGFLAMTGYGSLVSGSPPRDDGKRIIGYDPIGLRMSTKKYAGDYIGELREAIRIDMPVDMTLDSSTTGVRPGTPRLRTSPVRRIFAIPRDRADDISRIRKTTGYWMTYLGTGAFPETP